jgi:hypothetical protein
VVERRVAQGFAVVGGEAAGDGHGEAFHGFVAALERPRGLVGAVGIDFYQRK